MKPSPLFVKYEEEEIFDAHLDFAMFLEEAKQHTSEARHYLDDAVKQAECLKDNKKKKSWKRSLMFWRKSEKKIKPEHETPPPRESFHSNFPKQLQQQPRRNALSGPIHGSIGGQMGAMKRGSRPTSGPLAAALFTPSRRNEFEVPYMCLEQQNYKNNNKPVVRCEAFGPIYLVT